MFERGLRTQFELARKDGIPTNTAEFLATISPALPGENAAPYYKQLRAVPFQKIDLVNVDADVSIRYSPSTLTAAQEELERYSSQISLADKAARLPRCWFDRDWSQGEIAYCPEYHLMRSAARAVAVRGSIAAGAGDWKEAIHNSEELFVISRHAGEEGTPTSVRARDTVFQLAVQHLAVWAFKHPALPAYRNALDAAIKRWPKVNLQHIYRDSFRTALLVLDKMRTREGRKELGLKESNVSPLEGVAGWVKNRTKAQIDVASAERRKWEALALPASRRAKPCDEADDQISDALLAFPTLYGQDGVLDSIGVTGRKYDLKWEALRLSYCVLAEALRRGRPPTSLNTGRWLSPFDGRPLDYSWDGKQVIVDCRCSDPDLKMQPLKFPSVPEVRP